MRAPPPSLIPMQGTPIRRASSCTLQIFSATTSPSDPPKTVKSCAYTHTRRPSMVPWPVTTPSPGTFLRSMPKSVLRCTANMSVSLNEPGSSSASTRSLAVSLPLACCASTAFALPACCACSVRARRSSMRCFIVLGSCGPTAQPPARSRPPGPIRSRPGQTDRRIVWAPVGNGSRPPSGSPCRYPDPPTPLPNQPPTTGRGGSMADPTSGPAGGSDAAGRRVGEPTSGPAGGSDAAAARIDHATARALLPSFFDPIEAVEFLPSTMTRAGELAAAGAPEGAIVLADHQTAGKGRLGRTWVDRPGASLMLSVVLRPSLPADRLWSVTAATGVALAEAVAELLGPTATVALKWPNDLLVGGRKAAGLLAEGHVGGALVLGLGV